MCPGGVGFQPVARAFRRGRVPQARILAQLGEEFVEHLQSVRPTDVLRVQGHLEIAAALVLRCKLAAPVAQQRVRMFEAGSLAREHQKELVVEVVIIGHCQQRAAADEVTDPIMRNVVGQSVAEIDVAGLEQEVDRVGADRADRIAIALPRQRKPAGRFASRDLGENLGRARDAPLLLIAAEPTDILMPEAVCGDLMTSAASERTRSPWICAMTAGTAKVARTPCWRSISRNAASPGWRRTAPQASRGRRR